MLDNNQLLRFTTAGSVDDGKSTLIGRLLYDSKSIFEDQLEAITNTSNRKPTDSRLVKNDFKPGSKSFLSNPLVINFTIRFTSHNPIVRIRIAEMIFGAKLCNASIIKL